MYIAGKWHKSKKEKKKADHYGKKDYWEDIFHIGFNHN